MNPEEIRDLWQKQGVHKFTPKAGQKIFSINTPPPYPSGEPHAGYILNWGYIDFIARYKRMKGFAVLFPQGWDVHGLPTEVKVEQWKGKKSSDVPREEWVKWCNEWTKKYIELLKEVFSKLGFSIDWSYEYSTDDSEYKALVQKSFLMHLEKGYAYRGRHPVNWCVHCGTAVASAEVEYEERKAKLHQIKFSLAGEGSIVIATTRPELLPACVGIVVHPDDERYKEIVGRRAVVPLFGQEVEIFASADVDMNFGTGIVMICTFGDKQDVTWTFRHGLPIIDALDESGRMSAAAGKYKGLSASEAKKSIVYDLRMQKILLDEKDIAQSTGTCWRCHNAIEILNREQWFVRAVQLRDEVIHATKQVKWWPSFMSQRQIDWALSQTWDWVVSRQKVFGTPIPVWYCDKCKSIIPAEEGELPVDPTQREKKCDKCGNKARGERDTFDTWFDSSASNYFHAGWPKEGWEKFIPASLQPNGPEIIRTWDYYLMIRSLMLTGKMPYENVLINGWVLAEDGRKMSKSLGNFIAVNELLKKTSADSLRYWAARSTPGSDYPFSSKDIQHAEKFFNKLRNMVKFFKMMEEKAAYRHGKMPELTEADKWILSRVQRIIGEATQSFEGYTFPITPLEQFIWHEVADFYLEMIKYRIYENKNAEGALWTLRYLLMNSLKLLAPLVPYVAEEVYQELGGEGSIHQIRWPEVDKEMLNGDLESIGAMMRDVISSVRQWKNSQKLPQNAPLKELTVDKISLKKFEDDLKGTLKVSKISYGNAGGMKTEIFGIGVSVVK
ncbi:MAG: valine--tRNA ligase [Candidatus Aenigmarchaeota archaeon]|nr:valine--tRNA ligase [Candidatus Aenigmarchaeota archaeon]